MGCRLSRGSWGCRRTRACTARRFLQSRRRSCDRARAHLLAASAMLRRTSLPCGLPAARGRMIGMIALPSRETELPTREGHLPTPGGAAPRSGRGCSPPGRRVLPGGEEVLPGWGRGCSRVGRALRSRVGRGAGAPRLPNETPCQPHGCACRISSPSGPPRSSRTPTSCQL